MEHTFLECKQNIVAQTVTLMSISDRLGPSIFCRKMEKALPMKEEVHRKVVYFPARDGIFNFDILIHYVLYPICSSTWRVDIFISRQEKVQIGEMKEQISIFSEPFQNLVLLTCALLY